MGNSTTSLQSIVDYARTDGELDPLLVAGGFSQVKSLASANDTMRIMLSRPFNFKFNRIVIPPFYTISWQQDYAQINITNLGWLEHGVIVDINNSALPKPIFIIETRRDLERTSQQFGRPLQACWLPNNQLVLNTWPGPGVVITNPLGAITTPSNPFTTILDPNGNIEIVTTYGTTGAGPSWPAANATQGTTTTDGSVAWTVCNPVGAGFRLGTLPPQAGNVWQVNLVGQAKPPVITSLGAMLDPIPDDYVHHFRAGFLAQLYNHSSNPQVKAQWAGKDQAWRRSLGEATGQADREGDAPGFVPDRGIMDGGYPYQDYGPAWPFGK